MKGFIKWINQTPFETYLSGFNKYKHTKKNGKSVILYCKDIKQLQKVQKYFKGYIPQLYISQIGLCFNLNNLKTDEYEVYAHQPQFYEIIKIF